MPKVGHLQRFERAPVASVVSANLMSQVLLAFCVNQLVQASVSFSFYVSFRQRRPPEGIPGSNRGWTPVANTSKWVLFLPPSDAYVRSFLYLLCTLIKLYRTKALRNQTSFLALD